MAQQQLIPLLAEEPQRALPGSGMRKWPCLFILWLVAALSLSVIFLTPRTQSLEAPASVVSAVRLPRCHAPNLQYLGMAYDMAKGMPQPWQSRVDGEIGDPGWKMGPVFELGMGAVSEDGQCLEASGTFLAKDEECSFTTTSWEIATAYEFQKVLSDQFREEKGWGLSVNITRFEGADLKGLHFGIGSGAFFSQSKELRDISSKTRKSRHTLTTAMCSSYRAVLDFSRAKLSSAFRTAVSALPPSLEQGRQQYIMDVIYRFDRFRYVTDCAAIRHW